MSNENVRSEEGTKILKEGLDALSLVKIIIDTPANGAADEYPSERTTLANSIRAVKNCMANNIDIHSANHKMFLKHLIEVTEKIKKIFPTLNRSGVFIFHAKQENKNFISHLVQDVVDDCRHIVL